MTLSGKIEKLLRTREGFPKISATDPVLRRLQGRWALSRLLVLEAARRAAAVPTSIKAEDSSRLRGPIQSAHPGGARNVLRREGAGNAQTLRRDLLRRVRAAPGASCSSKVPALAAHTYPGRRQPDENSGTAPGTSPASALLARRRLLRLGRLARRQTKTHHPTGIHPPPPSCRPRDSHGRRPRPQRPEWRADGGRTEEPD